MNTGILPTFTKVFSPDIIGPGSVSTLTFTISNGGASTVTGLTFTDTLPAGVIIANPAVASTTCLDGQVSAPDGGGTITFDGRLGVGASCTATVDVTSSTVGTHANTSGDLTSSIGNSGSATDNLTVDATRPGFSKLFAPSGVPLGGTSTLTFTIDNTASGQDLTDLTFTDTFPPGLVVADPANVVNTCSATIGAFSFTGGVVTATPGASVVSVANGTSLNRGAVLRASSCSLSVDVNGTGIGMLDNVTGELTSSEFPGDLLNVSSGKASATLDVTVPQIALTKAFTNDPVPPGGTVNLEFTISNFNRVNSATGIAFTDNLGAALSGLAATGLPTTTCGGGTVSGTSTISLTGGILAPEGSCTFSVSVDVPGNAAAGSYANTTGTVTATVGGSAVTGNAATDQLSVAAAPALTKLFVGDPVAAGDDVIIRFTIDNTSTTSSATSIAFIDELTTFLPYPVSVALPPTPDPPCGVGSSLALVVLDTDRVDVGHGLSLTGGSLVASGTCTFDVTLTLPAGLGAGTYVNTTEEITATVDNATVTGRPASDAFDVVAAPRLTKEFTDDPAVAGGTVTLAFTLTHDGNSPGDATAIAFTDDLATTLTGLAATGLPLTDICGTGSSLAGSAGSTLLTFSGGTLAAAGSCTFSVSLSVPGGAATGSYTNTTSSVTATVNNVSITGPTATDTLQIPSLRLTKEFIDDQVIAGDTTTLRFTLNNAAGGQTASAVFFMDNLSGALAGLVAVAPLPASPCSGGSLSGTSTLVFTGGIVSPGSPCSFDVTVMVPAGAADGTYGNITSAVSSSLGTGDPATDELTVNSNLLQLTKAFTDDPVAAGSTVNLRFTLTNLDATRTASALAFTDALGGVVTGLVATGLPREACGGTLTGTDTISLAGGSLPAGTVCTVDVSLNVPDGAGAGTFGNISSGVTGTIANLAVTGDPALADLRVAVFPFTDDPLEGPIKAIHITQLRTHIGTLRASHMLAPYPWTDLTLVVGETIVRAVHLTDLRRALDDVRVAVGLAARTWQTDPALVRGLVIQAQDLTQLRTDVAALGP